MLHNIKPSLLCLFLLLFSCEQQKTEDPSTLDVLAQASADLHQSNTTKLQIAQRKIKSLGNRTRDVELYDSVRVLIESRVKFELDKPEAIDENKITRDQIEDFINRYEGMSYAYNSDKPNEIKLLKQSFDSFLDDNTRMSRSILNLQLIRMESHIIETLLLSINNDDSYGIDDTVSN